MSDPSASHAVEKAQSLPHGDQHVALIGLGAIGISFLALHLTYTAATVSVYDPRPDLQDHVASILPLYLPSPPTSRSEDASASATTSATAAGTATTASPDSSTAAATQISKYISTGRLRFCTTLQDAVMAATIIQEQGPENLAFKQKTWSEVLRHASPTAHLWSSTSGIPASQQLAHLSLSSSTENTTNDADDETISSARSRLLIVHPFNPPHIMPVLEIVPSPWTSPAAQSFATGYFRTSSPLHRPIAIAKETPGFVANRLSFVLFREACALVSSGVCRAEELDEIVRASLGPRWAVGGPFEMYNYGGGKRGLEGFLDNIGGAIDGVWSDVDGRAGIPMAGQKQQWKKVVVEQTLLAYGVPGPEDVRRRDRALREVIRVQEDMRKTK